MHTKLIIGAVSLLAAAGTGVAVSTAGASSTSMHEIVLFEPAAERVEVFVDLGDSGFSDGDVVLERAGLVWSDTGDPAGRAVTRSQVIEARVAPSEADPIGDFLFYLDCTVELDDGNLDFHGAGEIAELPTNGVTFTVSGGTGAYAGSQGTVRITPAEVDGIEGVEIAFELS